MTTRPLILGPVSILYENGFLRYVRVARSDASGKEIVRMVYFALRDEDWATIEPIISDEELDVSDAGFQIHYVCTHYIAEQPVFRWKAEIAGGYGATSSSAEITFSIEGEALAQFKRNRAGFCVLHPITETVGQPVVITHPDGRQTRATFPEFISPHQPFFNIEAMQWAVDNVAAGDVAATLRFAGDVFETEDQRNWTDASFKTYCTPLDQPKPVTLQPGDRVSQTVTLRLDGLPQPTTRATDTVVRITIDSAHSSPFPTLGLGHATGLPRPDDADVATLRRLPIQTLRLELDLTQPNWTATWQSGLAEAVALDWQLELAVLFGSESEAEWQALSGVLTGHAERIAMVTVLSKHHGATPDALLEELVSHIKDKLPKTSVGAGSNIHFTDLNRNRFDSHGMHYVSYAVNPQIHAFDNRSLVENLAAQADTLRSARQFVGDSSLHVSPVTLRPRFNADAIGDVAYDPAELPYATDPRQPTTFAAGWLLGSLKYLAEAGAAHVTFFETRGMNGLLMTGAHPRHPKFPAVTGPFPVYDVLHKVGEIMPTHVLRSESSQPLVVSSLALCSPTATWVGLANHTPEPQPLRIHDQTLTLAPHDVRWLAL